MNSPEVRLDVHRSAFEERAVVFHGNKLVESEDQPEAATDSASYKHMYSV